MGLDTSIFHYFKVQINLVTRRNIRKSPLSSITLFKTLRRDRQRMSVWNSNVL